ncbi:hypothetical protein [Nitrosomonas supralitoralis]|uniref:LPXTG-motif cell wall anchor domain-containing protein n=1 Tax=Nitrosomonas supralitoralis TaxID=2116706 RepID=A0A2P7NZ93_9PROT|nr:hypothetical protein [Nitrosomonas supralitoralis]PSJ18768.1 hypothetical protein C7H79_01755 [Nitrosomonas supralitoralis]
MKAASRNIWATALGSMVLASLLALPVRAQLMLAHEGHHDAGGCVIKTGEFPVTFSAYEVPEGGIPPMHSFCENLPNIGKVNLTVELPQQAREMLLAVRLVKEGHDGHSEDQHSSAATDQKTADTEDHSGHEGMEHDEHAGHGVTEHGVVYMPPEMHRSGIIVVAANIQEKGQYAIQLERKDDAGNVKTVVKIPLNVGKGGHGSHGGGFGLMEIALLVAAGGGAAFYFLRRKKASEASA